MSDKTAILKLLRLNTPGSFAPDEEGDLLEYLDSSAENYLVVEGGGEIIGAGGINYGFDNGRTARISWDMIDPSCQGKGVGTELLQFRIAEIKQNKTITNIVVRTTQFAYEFYEKNWFRLEKVSGDYWANGFDLYQMKMAL